MFWRPSKDAKLQVHCRPIARDANSYWEEYMIYHHCLTFTLNIYAMVSPLRQHSSQRDRDNNRGSPNADNPVHWYTAVAYLLLLTWHVHRCAA